MHDLDDLLDGRGLVATSISDCLQRGAEENSLHLELFIIPSDIQPSAARQDYLNGATGGRRRRYIPGEADRLHGFRSFTREVLQCFRGFGFGLSQAACVDKLRCPFENLSKE